MNRFLPALCCVLCLALGASAGWYFGYTRPSVKNQREMLEEVRLFRSRGMTDEELAQLGRQLPGLRRQIERSDYSAATIGLAVLKHLEAGDFDSAKTMLGQMVSIYYRSRYAGDTNFVMRIEQFAATNSALSNAIYGKLE